MKTIKKSTRKKPESHASYFPSTLFKIQVFKDFNEKEFIENLTYRLLNEAKKDSQQFGYGSAFQEIFEKSLVELQALKKEVVVVWN